MRRFLLLLWLLIATDSACAQEFHALGGVMQHTASNDRFYSWQLEYLEGLGEHFAFSLGYLNEGHVSDHHRDGHSIQFWARTNLLSRRLSLAAGVGPFYYFDTTAAAGGASYANDHGWGVNLSLAANWYMESRWFLQLRSNFVETGDSIDTVSLLLGVGYQLEAPSMPGPLAVTSSQPPKKAKSELAVYLGQSIVNSFHSEQSLAAEVEYRRRIWRYLDWSASWIYEGDNRLTRRNGLSSQLWGVKEFLADRLLLGIGSGAYFSVDHYEDHNQNRDRVRTISGIVTLTGSYRFHPNWDFRTSWHRIVTSYNRDTDLLLWGAGYRF